MPVRRNKGEGSITTTTRNGKTYYKASVTIGYDMDGKQIRKSFGSFRKSIVVDKINTVKYEVKNDLLEKQGDIKFGKLFLSWIQDFKKVEVSGNTFAEYEVCYRLRILPYLLANAKANEITLPFLQKYFNSLQNEWSVNVIRKTYVKINACLNFALIQGFINRNPAKGIKLPKQEKSTKYKVFTKEEQDLILQTLNLRNIVDTAIYFDFYTGLRLGELLGLKWEDLDGKLLSIKRQYQKNIEIAEQRKTTYILKELKTIHSYRCMTLPNKIVNLLSNMERTSEFIFPGIDGQPLEVKKLPRRLAAICKKLNIPHRSFHSIRHSFATRLFEKNVQIKTVQELMGHSEIATTMDIYTHVMPQTKEEAANILDSI